MASVANDVRIDLCAWLWQERSWISQHFHLGRHSSYDRTCVWLQEWMNDDSGTNFPDCSELAELPGLVLPSKSTPTEFDPAAVVAFKHLRDKVQTQMKRFKGLRPMGRARSPPHLDDFARLARRLCGTSIGVVLGGGGGKGISHLVSVDRCSYGS